jgi:glyoxylase I family protein
VRVNGFHHAAIEARDVEKVAAFFRDVLGLPEVVRHHRPDGSLRSIWLAAATDAEPGAPFIAVEEQPTHGTHSGAGWFMVALSISAAERHTIHRTLESRGVTIEKETRWTIFVRDPEGNLVGLSHYPADLVGT